MDCNNDGCTALHNEQLVIIPSVVHDLIIEVYRTVFDIKICEGNGKIDIRYSLSDSKGFLTMKIKYT